MEGGKFYYLLSLPHPPESTWHVCTQQQLCKGPGITIVTFSHGDMKRQRAHWLESYGMPTGGL